MEPSRRPRPGLRLADQPGEHAALEFGAVGAGHGERAGIGVAVLGVVNLPVPFFRRAARLHIEHDGNAEQRAALLARIAIVLVELRFVGFGIQRLLDPNQIAAERPAAIDDVDLTFLIFRQPRAERVRSERRRDRHQREPDCGNDDGCRYAKDFHGLPPVSRTIARLKG
jgi:hypothetical protein